jgi:hypothetical protein
VKWLHVNGFPNAKRQPLAGSKDIGDVWVCPWLIAEVKNHATWTDLDIDRWLDETEKERINAAADEAWLVVKRPGKASPANWWLFKRWTTYPAPVVAQYRLGEWVESVR